MDGQGGVGAALGEAKDRIGSDLVHEADAARAHDAALVVQADARADIDVFRLFHLHVDEARDAAAEANRLFLKTALARLIADRAVQGVVDQEKLHHAFAAFFDQLAGGADAHVFRDRIRAGDGGTWHPANFLKAVLIIGRLLTRGGATRHSHLDQAHPAVSWHCQLRMVTVIRHIHFDLSAGLDHPGAFGKFIPDTVDLDVYHPPLSGNVFG